MTESSAWVKKINAVPAKIPEEQFLLSELGAIIIGHKHETATDVDHDSPLTEQAMFA